ncbi:MAG: hypothetical protein IMY85_08805 [Chloroflexi bacterium]|nr:hypothetical protein [Chloroflexota bacterium]
MANNQGSLFTDGQANTTFYEQEKPGYLRIAGDDRHAFLQRQTSIPPTWE